MSRYKPLLVGASARGDILACGDIVLAASPPGDIFQASQEVGLFARVDALESQVQELEARTAQEVAATDTVTSNRLAYSPVPDMSLVPGAGKYVVSFSGSIDTDTEDATILVGVSIGDAGTIVSQRRVTPARGPIPFGCHTVFDLNDGDAVVGRWSVPGGTTASMYERTLILTQVG